MTRRTLASFASLLVLAGCTPAAIPATSPAVIPAPGGPGTSSATTPGTLHIVLEATATGKAKVVYRAVPGTEFVETTFDKAFLYEFDILKADADRLSQTMIEVTALTTGKKTKVTCNVIVGGYQGERARQTGSHAYTMCAAGEG